MKIFALFVVALTTVSAYPSDAEKEGRVIGGSNGRYGEVPWQVGMAINSYDYCGASLISEDWVLTAATCVIGLKTGTLYFGGIRDYEGQQYPIILSNIIIHPGYKTGSSFNNIAVIKLDTPITFTAYIQPVPLPPRSENYVSYEGAIAEVSGFGIASSATFDYPNRLQIANVPIVSIDRCTRSYDSYINDDFICASADQGQSTCEGDTGGPMTVDGVQVGIFAFGYWWCHLGWPTVFTRVSVHREWIYSTTGV